MHCQGLLVAVGVGRALLASGAFLAPGLLGEGLAVADGQPRNLCQRCFAAGPCCVRQVCIPERLALCAFA